MKTVIRTRYAFLATLALAAWLPVGASAQAGVNTSDAAAFMGSWAISFESPQGTMVMDLIVTDKAGKVAASIGAEMMGGMQDVANITKSGADLVLRYEVDAQGQMVPVAVTLTLNGAALDAAMDFADGMFVMDGTGAKK